MMCVGDTYIVTYRNRKRIVLLCKPPMREAESWTLYVDAKANKYKLKLKAKRVLLFPNLYQVSLKLKTTHPRVSFVKKLKLIKILEKCRMKIVGKRNSRPSGGCISCAVWSSYLPMKASFTLSIKDSYCRRLLV